jgi:hypothetical protein
MKSIIEIIRRLWFVFLIIGLLVGLIVIMAIK